MNSFADYQLEIKILIAKNLIKGIEKLINEISNESKQINKLLGIIGQHSQVSEDFKDGLISYIDKNTEVNRLRFKLIEFVDNLGLNDFKANFQPDHIKFVEITTISTEEDKIIEIRKDLRGNILFTTTEAFA